MKIPVVGFDPSFNNWGIAEAMLDLTTGTLDQLSVRVVTPLELKGKQVRQNSKDLHESEQLAKAAFQAAKSARAIFVEVPVGSQSARAMASYGICVGILGALRSAGFPVIEVTPTEVKLAFTGMKNATKEQMIAQAITLYPEVSLPAHRGRVTAKAEHAADAIAAIHAGVITPLFQNIMRLCA